MIGVLAKVSSSCAFDASAFTLEFAKHEISRYMAKPAQAIVDAVESGTDLLERIHASSVSTLHDFNCCISCNSSELVQPRMILGKIPEKWTIQMPSLVRRSVSCVPKSRNGFLALKVSEYGQISKSQAFSGL